jgi:hypothetical protein
VERELSTIEMFCSGQNGLKCSKELHLSYTTVKKKYDKYMQLISYYLEQRYQQNPNQTVAYGEYIYLEKSKKRDKKSILEAYNFITFDKGEIYSLLLDSLNAFHYSFRHSADDEYREFNSFLLQSKISKISKNENRVEEFWMFFEDFILKYKGINPKNFYYYLRLSEFFFNYDQDNREKILKGLVF